VLAQTNWIMFGRRGAAAPAPATPPPPAPAIAEAPPAAEPAPLFDDLAIGDASHLGSHVFTAEEIVRFALQYDPQPFHVDADAAARSHFGALCASGWHTAAVWMKQMIAHRERSRAAARAAGTEPARLGPSPGFRDMKWLRPVYAGDVITYTSTVVDTRASASRPQWGLVSHHNTGVNQRGERVFEFQGTVFWERQAIGS
jgi:acyl dehydratase